MRIIGNRGVRLPDYKEHVLSKGIETPDLPDRLYIPVPEELLTELQPGEGFRRGQFLWENEYHLPVYCPADGVVEDVVRLSHPLFGDGCYLLLSELKRVRGSIPLPKNTPPELAEKARCAAILDEVDGVPLFSKLKSLKGFNGTLVADATAADPYTAAAVGVLAEDPALVRRGLELAAAYTGAARWAVTVTAGADGGRPVRRAFKGHLFVTGKKYPTHRLFPRHTPAPVAVMGVQALAALARAEEEGVVADTFVVTVNGTRVFRPRNLRVLTGTPVSHLFKYSEADKPELLVMGGVMTGLPFKNEDIPASAGVTCLLGMQTPPKRVTRACTGCGECIRACHRGLLPCEIARLLGNMQYERLPALEATRCDGCGACSYVCPANREVAAAVREARDIQHTIFMDLEGG